jgi:LysR family glycine cleavage system transcriptional activator
MKLARNALPDLSVLQAFECAARHGSFTQAAAELNLTQSAVSRQIRTLEDQLHVTLFERIRKRVVLSAAGKALLPDVVRLLGQTEEMVLRAMAAPGGKDTLTVATLPTFGNRWLMKRLPAFLAEHPGTVLTVASRSEPFDLMAEDFDIAIHYGQPVWAHATCTYLCSEIILPVASPALLANQPVRGAADFEKAPLLHLTTRPRLWSDWFQANDHEGAAAFQGHRFDQFSMIIEAALQGLGFALLPRYLIEDELGSGHLAIALDRPITTANSYYIVTPEGKQGTAIARQFQDWLLGQVSR